MEHARRGRYLRGLAAFTAAFLLCVLVTGLYIHNRSQVEHIQMEQLALTRANKVNNVIHKLVYKTQALAALVIQSNGEVEDFDRVAATIIDDPAIQNVILAPDGVVSHVYPLAGNEAVMGLDYFSDQEGNREAIQARDSGQLVLGGPFHLVQGGQALVGRLPVYLEGADGTQDFWGLVSVTLRYPDALDGAELDQLQEQGYAFEIWRVSPDTNQRQVIASSNYSYSKHTRYVEQPLEILNATWYFRVSPVRDWYQFYETWVFLGSGLCISLLFASLVLHNHDLRRMKKSLTDLTYTDPLTGACNRRGIFRTLEDWTGQPHQPFLLCYLDLNAFKVVNDTYGHNAGDQILLHVAETFQRHLQPGDRFGRIGGDEFVLLCTRGRDAVERLLSAAREALSQDGGTVGAHTFPVSFSVGMAAFPQDGETPDDLLTAADIAMYQEKGRS